MTDAAPTGHLVVDAMNVIGSRPTGWWRDRDEAVRRFVERLRAFATPDGPCVTVVIDGRPVDGLPEGAADGLRVLYAARAGPNAADDRIVELVDAHAEPASLAVVTSDRGLAVRVEARGARVHRASWLLRRLDAIDGPAT